MATNPNVLAFAPPLALRLLNKHSPREIAEAIEILIDVLDAIGGNPDEEEDDPSGQCDEDEVNTTFELAASGSPGCEISDPGGCEHDGREHEDGY